MDAMRRAFNLCSYGLYSSSSVSLSMISTFTSFIASTVGWSVPNRVDRITLSCVWAPCDMARVEGRDTTSGAVSMAASAREGVALPNATTWYWLARSFKTFRVVEVCWTSPNWWRPMPKLLWYYRRKPSTRVNLIIPGVTTIITQMLRRQAVLSSSLCSLVRFWRFGSPPSFFHMGGGPCERLPGSGGGVRWSWTLGVPVPSSLCPPGNLAPFPHYPSSSLLWPLWCGSRWATHLPFGGRGPALGIGGWVCDACYGGGLHLPAAQWGVAWPRAICHCQFSGSGRRKASRF